MDEPRRVIEPLGAHHDRAGFSCGEAALDGYLARQASQDARRRVARVFVAVGDAPSTIDGYYTLSALGFDKQGRPAPVARRLPHHPIPAALAGRLAVDRRRQGRGLGETLLIDAIRRVLAVTPSLAVYAIVVDAKNTAAQAFYQRFGFQPFIDEPRRLFLPIETVEKLGF